MELPHRLKAAEGYFELGMLAEARAEIAEIPPESRALTQVLQLRIQLDLREEQWESALALSRQLCDVAPDSTVGFIHGAYCLHELGRTEEARELLMDGPESLRNEPVFFYNLGCYEAKLGETESARAWLLRSFEMDADLRRQAKDDPDLADMWEELAD